jgi:GTPase SAR1 family protein
MSCFGAKDPKRKDSIQIDTQIKQDQKDAKRWMKILLLGTGDSGKSTFARQLANLNGQMPTAHIITFVPDLRSNTLCGALQVLEAATQWDVPLTPELKKIKDIVSQPDVELTDDLAKGIEGILKNQSVLDLLNTRGDQMQLQGGIEGVKYYFQHARRFAAPDFVPTFEDVLKARRKTSGIVETIFEYENISFTLVDVGGQRSERKKWLHCFSTVSAVIYLTAINEYDMLLEEDANTNRLVESLKLWKALTSSEFFIKTPFILFLNKSDLFKQKLEKVRLSEVFQEWDDYAATPGVAALSPFEQGWRFLAKLYEKHFAGSSFYAHVTCAIDSKSCVKVWASVRDEMVRRALGECKL